MPPTVPDMGSTSARQRTRRVCRQLEVTQRDDVVLLVNEARPDIIINVAARQSDWAITADGGMHVAAAAAAVGARLVHVSSDAVFSGAVGAIRRNVQPDPTTAYGAAKAAAESAVKGLDPASIIARTSLIVGDGNSPREQLVRELVAGTKTGVLFTDDIRCPVLVTDLASALLGLARSPHSGIHHVTGSHAVSRYELGVLIALRAGLDATVLVGCSRASTGLPGPLEIRLDCTKTQSRLTRRLRGARTFLSPALV